MADESKTPFPRVAHLNVLHDPRAADPQASRLPTAVDWFNKSPVLQAMALLEVTMMNLSELFKIARQYNMRVYTTTTPYNDRPGLMFFGAWLVKGAYATELEAAGLQISFVERRWPRQWRFSFSLQLTDIVERKVVRTMTAMHIRLDPGARPPFLHEDGAAKECNRIVQTRLMRLLVADPTLGVHTVHMDANTLSPLRDPDTGKLEERGGKVQVDHWGPYVVNVDYGEIHQQHGNTTYFGWDHEPDHLQGIRSPCVLDHALAARDGEPLLEARGPYRVAHDPLKKVAW